MKRVLIVTSLFPPGGGPGAKRILQFVRNLLPLDWDPIVLTHKNFFMGYDEKSLSKVPEEVKVFRTISLEQHLRNTPNYIRDSRPKKPKGNSAGVKNNSFVRFLKDTVGAPDSGMLWMPFATWRAILIYRRTKYDVVFATGPPFSTFLIGCLIKLLTRQPLVLDFRDAWIAGLNAKKGGSVKFYLNELYEKIVIKYADHVIANTTGVRNDFISRYRNAAETKFVVIPNGFDDDVELSDDADITLDKTKFNIVHTGSLGGIRTPKNFLKAIRELIDCNLVDPDLIRIHLVGLINDFSDGCSVQTYIDEYQLQDQVCLTGFVSRDDAFAYNFEADLLLLIIGITDKKLLPTYGLSGKVYDYVVTGKPILALAQVGGATYDLLAQNNIGTIANPADADDIKEKTLKIYRAWQNGDLESNYDPESLSTHNMKNLTNNLSQVFSASM